MNGANGKIFKTAARLGALAAALSLASAFAPYAALAQDCSVSWTNPPTGSGCKTNCMKSAVFCNWGELKSWASGASSVNCVVETAKPANPANGQYISGMDCTANKWKLTCDSGYAGGYGFTTGHCTETACHPNIAVPPECTGVNQCTDLCTGCQSTHYLCAGVCRPKVVIANCATYDYCNDKCTLCNTGYELIGNACVGVTLKLSKNSVKGNQDLMQSAEPAVMYISAAGNVGISTGSPQYQLHVGTSAGYTGTMLAVTTGTTSVFWVDGDGAHASKFFVSGSDITDLNANSLTSGTVPLARLWGITDAQIDAAAAIADTKLAAISTAGKVADSALSSNVALLDSAQTFTGAKTFSAQVDASAGVSGPYVQVAPGVLVSSEASADLGAGVRVSSNIYVVGFASAAKFFGDGSGLTGIGGSGSGLDADTLDLLDSLDFVRRTGDVNELIGGNKDFAGRVTVSSGVGTALVDFAPGVSVSSEAAPDLGGGLRISSNVYIVGFASATKLYGDATELVLSADKLASGTVPLGRLSGITSAELAANAGILDTQLDTISTAGKVQDTALSSNVSLLGAAETVSGVKTFTSTVTVAAVLGAPRVELADGVAVSSEASADLGAGLRVSTNIYIVGFASAPYFYGDGSHLTGIGGSGSALDADTIDTLDSLDFVRRTGDVNELIGGSKDFAGRVTVSSGVGTALVDFAPGVAVSSEASADLGGGLRISSNVYIVGFASATKYYGDATELVLSADKLASGTVPLGRLSGITSAELAAGAGILDTQLGVISTAGKVQDTALSANVSLLDATQTITGAKTFSSTVAVAGLFSTPKVELAGNVYVSSEASAVYGAGVRVSSNVYIVGFASAPYFYGDGSHLTGIGGSGSALDADTLDTFDSTDFLRRTGNVSQSVNGAKTFTSSVTVTDLLGLPRAEFAPGVDISSEAAGGLRVSSDVYVVGYASAAKFYGDGAGLTALNASNLASGTVPLARLAGLTSAELAAGAGILDTQLGVISTAGKVQDTALSANVSLLDATQTVTGVKTFTSTVTVAAALGAPRVELADGVYVSSEASAVYGAGVRVSSNVYIVGYASAPYFYGDGSHLTGIGGSGSALDADTLDTLDSLDFLRRTGNVSQSVNGAKTFTSSVTVTGLLGLPRAEFAPGVDISSEAAGGLRVSSDVYVVGYASAAKFYGDGGGLVLDAGTLASGTVPLARLAGLTSAELAANAGILDTQLGAISTSGKVHDTALSANVSLLNAAQTVTGAKTFASTVTVASLLGAPRVELAANVYVSSEASAQLGGGVRVSSNVYIVGYASATKYYGDGSGLTGIGGSGSALDADTLDTFDSTDFLRRTGNVAQAIDGAKTFTSSVTVTGLLGLPRAEFAPGVELSSGAAGGLRVSSDVYVAGNASAVKFYGDGSGLTALDAGALASGTVPLGRLAGITSAELAAGAGILDTQLGAISTAGKVQDTALSANVSLLNATQTITGAKTFSSTVAVAGLFSTPKVELAANVSVSSEASALLGGGVLISTNVYVVGFASAPFFYGDGSHLTGIGGAGSSLDADTLDTLDSTDFLRRTGNVAQTADGYKTFTGSMTVAGGLLSPRLDLAQNVSVSSESAAELGGGLGVSTNVYIVGYASAAKFFGDGAGLTALNAGALASGVVPLERLAGLTSSQLSLTAGILDTQLDTISAAGKVQDTALSANVMLLDATQTVTGQKSFTGVISAPGISMAPDIFVSSASASYGSGVLVSSHLYVLGFASATVFYGDGSKLTGIGGGAGSGLDADRLDTLDSSDFVRRTGNVSESVDGEKTFTSTVTMNAALLLSRAEFSPGVTVSSEASADLGGGLAVSTNVYMVGYASAAKFFGDGSGLILDAGTLASGTVPLERLTGLTSSQLSLSAGILDTQLDTISTAGKVQDTALSANVMLLDATQTVTGLKEFSGPVSAPGLALAPNVYISSEAGADYGAGVRFSSHVYIVGFSSAAAYYGDGSHLTGIGGGGSGLDADTLDTFDSTDFLRRTGGVNQTVDGYKTFTASMTVTSALALPRADFGPGVTVSSESAAELGGGLSVSTNVYVVGFASAAKFYGDGSGLTGLTADNAGMLDFLDSADFVRRTGAVAEVINGTKTFTSSVTVVDALGLAAARLELSPGIELSSETATGVRVSSNVYIMGYASATMYFGDGSKLTGIGGGGSGLDADKLDGLHGDDYVHRTGNTAEEVTGAKTFTSSVTVTGLLGLPKTEYAPGVAVSSEASAALGGGLRVSSNVYIVGYASAAKFFGDGSGLTGLGADNANTIDFLDSLDFVRRTGAVAEVITGTKTFVSSVTVADAMGLAAARLELAPGIGISSEPVAGVRVSSNVYIVGYASATTFFGDGSHLTGLGGGGSGLDADKLDGLHGSDYVQRTGDVAEEVTGAKTFTSSVTVTGLLGLPKTEYAPGVAVSSEASAAVGGGLRISSNVFIVGFASATKYFGDGSGLTGLGADNANSLDFLDSTDFVRRTGAVAEIINGTKTFTSSVTVVDAMGLAAARLELAPGIELSSEPATGVRVSSNVYIIGYASAAKYFGDGSALTGLGGSGSGLDADKLDGLHGDDYVHRTGNVAEEVTGAKTFTSSVTVPGLLGFAPGVAVSSEPSAELGGGLRISSNVYIVGYASATKYFGDGSGLTGLGADNANTLDFLDSLDFVRRTGSVAEVINGTKTFTSSVTVVDALGLAAARLELSPGIELSSETATGVRVSSNVYIIGYSSAAKYFGDGSALTGLGGSGSGLDADKLDGLHGAAYVHASGNWNEVIDGTKTFTSSITVQDALGLGAARVGLAANIEISSEASAALGGGLRVSTNVYIVGYSSAAKYYGDGSGLTGLTADYAPNASKLYSTDASYAYGSAEPYYGYLTNTGSRWLFRTSAAQSDVEVAYAADADKLDGLHVHAGVNNEANKVVRTDANGYLQTYWINMNGLTANVAQPITRIYASDDSFIRYYSTTSFIALISTPSADAESIVRRNALGGFSAGPLNLSGTLTFSGVATDITTGANENLALMPAGTGAVGVGTDTPDQKLTVAGNISQTGVIVSSGAGNNYFAGNMGVGVPAPTYKFEVNSAGGSTMQFDTSNPGYVSIRVGGVEVARLKP